jgi:hypothetical protein
MYISMTRRNISHSLYSNVSLDSFSIDLMPARTYVDYLGWDIYPKIIDPILTTNRLSDTHLSPQLATASCPINQFIE